MPLIELCEECAYWINKHLSYDKDFQYDLSIKTINSSNSKSENEMNKRADVIVTTIQSAGTGTDIPGITDIICCSPYCSRITAEQVMGRIRYIPKKCHYYDIYDTSVQMDIFWLRSRIKKFKTIAASVNYLTFDE
jgi:superfamily II DNA or RNA helicase